MFPIVHNRTCLAILEGVTSVANSDKILTRFRAWAMQYAVFHNILSGVFVLRVNAISPYFHVFLDTASISQI